MLDSGLWVYGCSLLFFQLFHMFKIFTIKIMIKRMIKRLGTFVLLCLQLQAVRQVDDLVGLTQISRGTSWP